MDNSCVNGTSTFYSDWWSYQGTACKVLNAATNQPYLLPATKTGIKYMNPFAMKHQQLVYANFALELASTDSTHGATIEAGACNKTYATTASVPGTAISGCKVHFKRNDGNFRCAVCNNGFYPTKSTADDDGNR